MDQLNWLQLAIWLILIAGGYILKRPIPLTLGSLYGFGLAWTFYDLDFMVSLTLLCTNIYLLFESLSDWDHS